MPYRTKNKLFAWLWARTHWNLFWKLGYERYLAEWEKDRRRSE